MSNDERRDVLDRLCDRSTLAGIELIGTGSTSTVITDWHVNTEASRDDRDYVCASCGSTLRVRGLVAEGHFSCCGDPVTRHQPAPRRGRSR